MKSSPQPHLELAGSDRVDEVRQLWLDLHHHHQAVVGALSLVEDDELSWQRRRALYVERLDSGNAFLILASEQSAVVGYALVCIEPGPDDTFPVGERYAELYSLSVAPARRGQGIGTRLLDRVDQELAQRSIGDLKVAVMAGNTEAQRLYERRGLRPAEVVLYRFGGDTLGRAGRLPVRPRTPARAGPPRARSTPSWAGRPRSGDT